MKAKRLYIFTLFLMVIFGISSIEAQNAINLKSPKAGLSVKASTNNSENLPNGNSPLIRFHNGIDENSVSVPGPFQSITILKHANAAPSKFAGLLEYLTTLSYRLPGNRVFNYSTPLRSPPFVC